MAQDSPQQSPSAEQLGASEELHPLLQKVVDHAKVIIAVFAAVILAVGGYGLYDYLTQRALDQASNELGMILVTTQGAERQQALQEFVAEAPEVMLPAARLELAAAAMEQQDYQAALAAWDTLAASENENVAAVAGLGKARCLQELDRGQEALAVLESLQGSAPEAYATAINRQVASAAEDQGDWAKALSAYQSLMDSPMVQNKAYFEHKVQVLTARLQGQG
jgi:hypothetical protein